jgi:anti-sigma regulatory factor (Ser/Thr protein kinase)
MSAGTIANGTIAISVRDYGSWRQQRERAQGGYGFALMRQHMDTVEVHSQPERTTITMQRQLAPSRLH